MTAKAAVVETEVTNGAKSSYCKQKEDKHLRNYCSSQESCTCCRSNLRSLRGFRSLRGDQIAW